MLLLRVHQIIPKRFISSEKRQNYNLHKCYNNDVIKIIRKAALHISILKVFSSYDRESLGGGLMIDYFLGQNNFPNFSNQNTSAVCFH